MAVTPVQGEQMEVGSPDRPSKNLQKRGHSTSPDLPRKEAKFEREPVRCGPDRSTKNESGGE